MSVGVEGVTGAPRRVGLSWLWMVLISAGLAALIIALLSSNVSGLLTKALTKIAPPDPYQLQQHQQREQELLAAMQGNPKDPAVWLEAVQFELAANSPFGAAWCLREAKALGAQGAEVDELTNQVRVAESRWRQLYEALLRNRRFADGNNSYADIYPVIQQLRGDAAPHQVTGKVRADLDLLEAHLLLREGRRTEARPLLAALREQPGPLQGLAAYLYAKTWLREADSAPARRAFQEYLQRHPGERLNAYAAYELGNLALQAGDRANAEEWFTQVITRYPDSPQARVALLATLDITLGVVPDAAPSTSEAPTAEHLFDLGAAPSEQGDASEPKSGTISAEMPAPVQEATQPDSAAASRLDPRLIPDDQAGWDLYGDLFRTAYASLDVQRRALELYRILLLPDKPPLDIWRLLTPSSALGWAEALAAAGVEKGAIRLADWGVTAAGDAEHRVALARLRGRLLIGQRKFEEARKGLEQARGLLVGKTDVALLDYEIARSWRLAANAGQARPWYLRAAETSIADLASDALAQAAWAAAQRSDWDAALSNYRTILQRYPTSVYADVAREHLLSDAMRHGQLQTALELAKKLEAEAVRPGRHVRGAYYVRYLQGVADEEWSTFFDRYALTYYGHVTAGRLQRSYRDWAPSAADLTFARLREQENSVLGATMMAGLWDISAAEWEEMSPTTGHMEAFRLLTRSLLTATIGVPKDTILDSQAFLDRGGPSGVAPGWTALMLDATYPLSFLDQVEIEAERYSFPSALLMGIIRQESFFQPKAKSTAGARGLMQLMPATGTWAAKQVGMGTIQLTALEDPATNLRLATWHLDFLRRNGATSFGPLLAAHNGGPGNLAKWRERYGGPEVPEWLFLELIPNQESREFVRQVLANSAVYDYLLARPADPVVF